MPLFARLGEAEQADLHGRMKPRRVEAGEVVVWHGEQGESLFLISNGTVDVVVPNERGEHVHLAKIGRGGFFGELSLLDSGPRTATVRASERCELLELHRDQFMRFLMGRPDAALDMLGLLATRQREGQAAMRSLNPNEAFAATRITMWQRLSDIIATVSASQWFSLFHVAWFGTWIILNVTGSLIYARSILVPEESKHLLPGWVFDPFPFGLLTMVVSLEAIFLAIFVMVSQNRQSEKDRLRTDLDYQVNVRAQEEILRISQRLSSIETRMGELTKRD
ncbi:MAG: DUF1003 domain-containing protein [Phycisphaerales bacterium]